MLSNHISPAVIKKVVQYLLKRVLGPRGKTALDWRPQPRCTISLARRIRMQPLAQSDIRWSNSMVQRTITSRFHGNCTSRSVSVTPHWAAPRKRILAGRKSAAAASFHTIKFSADLYGRLMWCDAHSSDSKKFSFWCIDIFINHSWKLWKIDLRNIAPGIRF